MIDITTETGYAAIKWVSAPGFSLTGPRWICHQIMHCGDGPLGRAMSINAPVGSSGIDVLQAAEIAAASLYEGYLSQGESETIRIAVQLHGLEFCAVGVRVTLEPQFEAREL